MARRSHEFYFLRRASLSEMHRAVKAFMAQHAPGTQFTDHVVLATEFARPKEEVMARCSIVVFICDNTEKNDAEPFLVFTADFSAFPEGARSCTNPGKVVIRDVQRGSDLLAARGRYEKACKALIKEKPSTLPAPKAKEPVIPNAPTKAAIEKTMAAAKAKAPAEAAPAAPAKRPAAMDSREGMERLREILRSPMTK